MNLVIFLSYIRINELTIIIDRINYYGYSGNRVKGLVFCSSKQEAKALSDEFNKRGFKLLV